MAVPARKLTDHLFASMVQDLEQSSPKRDREKAAVIRSRLFPAQRDFIDDTGRRKALLCPRRAGKSFVAAAYLVETCLRRPGSNCLFITLTRPSARGILWTPPGTGLKRIDEEFELGLHFHNTNLVATFPNGSAISLIGADSRSEVDRQRGQAYDLVVIDESKSFPHEVLTELVEEVLGPALNDRMGTLAMVGTPGSILAGVFYDATKPESAISRPWKDRATVDGTRPFRWSFHQWNVRDNVAMPHLWQACLEDKAAYGWSDDNPIWQREYLGHWLADDDALVYRYNHNHDGRNDWVRDPSSSNAHGLPTGHEWEYVLGVDLGYDDDTALVVMAYSSSHPDLYQVFEFKSQHMTVLDVATKIRETEVEFGEFTAIVGDKGGAGKQVLESLARDHRIAMQAAEKTEKRDYIELVNSDLLEGRIKIIPDGLLATELRYNAWDETRRKEDDSCANDLCDSFLYSWRYCYHRHATNRPVPLVPGSPAALNAKIAEQRHAAQERKRRSKDADWWDPMAADLDGGDAVSWDAYDLDA